jgi:hypothetical protein
VLGRNVVLIVSSGCLNTRSCSQKKTRVVGWCKGELLFSVIQVDACVTGKLVLPSSWCWNTQGVGASF